MFDSRLPVSYYKIIGTLNEAHGVFVAQHRETGKVCVLKKLPVYHLSVYAALYRYPVKNTPRIYALYEDRERQELTVVEEYISGETLEEYTAICGALPEEEVLGYMLQLTEILAQLHAFRPPLIHRDIKPSNVILTEDGRIVLLDMNAAKPADASEDRDTMLLGTQGFAAPEQYGFGASTTVTDFYAVGALMNYLLTGGAPGAHASGRLKPVIDRCQALRPQDRYPDVNRLREALETLKDTSGKPSRRGIPLLRSLFKH